MGLGADAEQSPQCAQTLVERESRTARLEEAIAAYCAALGVRRTRLLIITRSRKAISTPHRICWRNGGKGKCRNRTQKPTP
jgi:hypothetical protein